MPAIKFNHMKSLCVPYMGRQTSNLFVVRNCWAKANFHFSLFFTFLFRNPETKIINKWNKETNSEKGGYEMCETLVLIYDEVFLAQPAIGANVLESGSSDSRNYNCISESMSLYPQPI